MPKTWSELCAHFGRRRTQALIASGDWVRRFPNVYIRAQDSSSRPELHAALLKWAPPGSALSHRTAAALHQLDLRDEALDLTVPALSSPRAQADVTMYRSLLGNHDCVVVQGLRCTAPARTVLDLCATAPFIDAAIAAEAAWRKSEKFLTELSVLLDRPLPGRPGTTELRRITADLFARAKPLRSALEVRMWWLLRGSGLPLPTPGHEVRDRSGRMEIDFAYVDQKLALETDGKEVHGPEQFDQDARRQARLVALGWRVGRFGFKAIVQQPDEVITQVRTALKLGRWPKQVRRWRLPGPAVTRMV